MNNGELEIFLKQLVEEKRSWILEQSEAVVRIESLFLSDVFNRHPLSYGRLLTIHFSVEKMTHEKTIYLKFRKNYTQVPDKYMVVYDKFSSEEQFLPKFYFHAQIPGSDESVIAMEYIKGLSLRKLLYQRMLFRQSGALTLLFYQNGRKMRLFHDAQTELNLRTPDELLEKVLKNLSESKYFSALEKQKISAHLNNISEFSEVKKPLGLIHIHHDWSLRNIIVDSQSRIMLIDLDAYDRSVNWRWEDFVYFLINIESQIKYWPFLSRKNLLRLWEHFSAGYFEAGASDGVSKEWFPFLAYLIKLDYWTDTWSLENFYNCGLGKLYVRELKKSFTRGEWTILKKSRFLEK